MKEKIVRLTRKIGKNQYEERIYIKSKEGKYMPIFIPTEQTEEIQFTEEREIGEIDLGGFVPKKINFD